MTGILIIFMLVIFILAIILIVIVKSSKHIGANENFLNEEGDHLYYDRSIIEKKEFAKKHPDVKNVRSFSRLFGGRKEKD